MKNAPNSSMEWMLLSPCCGVVVAKLGFERLGNPSILCDVPGSIVELAVHIGCAQNLQSGTY
jgi:uncharacterized membrane protein YjjB (DUF3815 family)